MAEGSRSKRQPRIRKAPTVRDQIENATQKSGQSRLKSKNFSLFGLIKRFLAPFSPVGRIIAKVLNWLFPRYFINAWRELRQVTWPSRGETWRLTGAVFVFAVVFGALVAVVDKGLDEFFKKVILK